MAASETDQAPRVRRKQLRLAEAAVSAAGGHVPPPSQFNRGAWPAAAAVGDAVIDAESSEFRVSETEQDRAHTRFAAGESMVDLNASRAAMGLPPLGLPVSPRQHMAPISILFLAVVCVLALLVALLIFLKPPLGAWIPALG